MRKSKRHIHSIAALALAACGARACAQSAVTLYGIADAGLAGTSRNLFPDSSGNVRASNTLMDVMPAMRGVRGELA